MTVEIKDSRGRVIRRSKNLRGVSAHARGFRFCDVHTLTQDGCTLHVHYANGDTCETHFADASVLRGWINNRVRYGRGRWVAP